MAEDKLHKVSVPEPYHLILSLPLFQSIKNNQGLRPSPDEVTEEEAKEFEKFKKLFKEFMDRMNRHDSSAFSILSTIMGLWGYSRKYCGMCGRPIIGKPGHIENRMVCAGCNESYKITQRLLKDENLEEVKTTQHPGKFYNKETKYKRKSPPSPRDPDTIKR
jgi:hypothetical protein